VPLVSQPYRRSRTSRPTIRERPGTKDPGMTRSVQFSLVHPSVYKTTNISRRQVMDSRYYVLTMGSAPLASARCSLADSSHMPDRGQFMEWTGEDRCSPSGRTLPRRERRGSTSTAWLGRVRPWTLAGRASRSHACGMFVVSEAEAAAIRPPSIEAVSYRPPSSCAGCSQG
jgi:hypothetical protein